MIEAGMTWEQLQEYFEMYDIENVMLSWRKNYVGTKEAVKDLEK